jgi:hypothetical protein
MPKQPESRISEQAIESVIAEAAQRIRDIIMPGVAALIDNGLMPKTEVGSAIGRENGYTVITEMVQIDGSRLRQEHEGYPSLIICGEGLFTGTAHYLSDMLRAENPDRYWQRAAPLWPARQTNDLLWIGNARIVVDELKNIRLGHPLW